MAITMNSIPTPNAVDIGAIVVILFGIIMGIRRGLSGELARFIGTVAALSLGLYSYKPFGMWLVKHTRLEEQPAFTVAFILTVLGVLVITLLIRLILKSIMKISFEGSIEKIGGFLAGLIRSLILVLIVFVAMNMWPHDYLNRLFGKESIIGRKVVKYMPVVKKHLDKLPVKEEVENVREKMSEDAK